MRVIILFNEMLPDGKHKREEYLRVTSMQVKKSFITLLLYDIVTTTFDSRDVHELLIFDED